MMAKCEMCGKQFDETEVDNYLIDKLGFDGFKYVVKQYNTICDSCALGIYYAEHDEDDANA